MYIKFFIKILLIYLSVGISNSFAYTVSAKAITDHNVFIQIGAFLQKNSIENVKKNLQKYPIYTEISSDYTRLYVTFDERKYNTSAMLKKIHKIYPKAFIKRNVLIHLVHDTDASEKKNIIYHNNSASTPLKNTMQILDSDAILKTRKKFFNEN